MTELELNIQMNHWFSIYYLHKHRQWWFFHCVPSPLDLTIDKHVWDFELTQDYDCLTHTWGIKKHSLTLCSTEWKVLRWEKGDQLKADCRSLKAARLCFWSSACFFFSSCSWRISASNRLDSLMAWTCSTERHIVVKHRSAARRVEAMSYIYSRKQSTCTWTGLVIFRSDSTHSVHNYEASCIFEDSFYYWTTTVLPVNPKC